MIEASFDSNIVIDFIQGYGPAHDEVDRYDLSWISRVSWIEVMAGIDPAAFKSVQPWLKVFLVDELNQEIAARAVELRRGRPRLKLPDAIILASAEANGRTLVTRNTRDFPADRPGIRVPYTL